MQTKLNQVEILRKVPKIRENTYWEKLPNGEYYIRNTSSGNPLIVSEYVINFLTLATGKSTIKQICEKAGLPISNSNIEKIYELYYTTLYPTGILETGKIENKRKKGYINLGFTILPEKNVIFFSKYLTFLFQKKVVILSLFFCLLVILGGGIHFLRKGLSFDALNTFNPIVVVVLIVIVFFLHELGHSSALYYYGEIPRKIGMGLYLFAPVLFADVTDSWKLNNKQRIIVDLGGLYFQLIISCFYLFIFLISANNDFIFATFLSFIIGIFNLNPFVKMDGYWILSDFLNIPDLKQKARQKTVSFIRCVFKRRFPCRKRDIAFILYYVMNLSFSMLFILYMLIWNIELFRQIPVNMRMIILSVFEGEYTNVSILLIESVILPFIVVFLVLNILFKLLVKNLKEHHRLKLQRKKAHNILYK